MSYLCRGSLLLERMFLAHSPLPASARKETRRLLLNPPDRFTGLHPRKPQLVGSRPERLRLTAGGVQMTGVEKTLE